MLVSEKIKIKVRKNLIDYYDNLQYSIINNEVIVNSNDLHNGSNAVINVICDHCRVKLTMMYKNYYKCIKKYDDELYYCQKCKYYRIKQTNMIIYGVDNVMQLDDIKNKMIETQKSLYGTVGFRDKEKTDNNIIHKYGSLKKYYDSIIINKKISCIKKYGVDNVMKVEEIKQKGIQTCYDRYGEYNPMYVDEFAKKSTINQIKTKTIRNLMVSNEKLTDFQKYKKVIRRLIYKYKTKLFEKWDGNDYYDGEYIRDNLSLHYLNSKYPTIDHKISVFFGFNNNTDPSVIGNIDNLCITKRGTNSSKHLKNSDEYKK